MKLEEFGEETGLTDDKLMEAIIPLKRKT